MIAPPISTPLYWLGFIVLTVAAASERILVVEYYRNQEANARR
jgi:hypothetical protein